MCVGGGEGPRAHTSCTTESLEEPQSRGNGEYGGKDQTKKAERRQRKYQHANTVWSGAEALVIVFVLLWWRIKFSIRNRNMGL